MKIKYATKGLIVKKKFDNRVIVKDNVEYLRFSTSYEKGSVGVSYISAPQLNVDSNILIKDHSFELENNSLEKQREFLKLSDNFQLDHAHFWITDVFKELNGESIPLYLRHNLSHVSNISHVEVLDSDHKLVDPALWLYSDESDAQEENHKSIYTNLECSIDRRDSTYNVYYVRYKDLDTKQIKTELLDSKPFYERSSFYSSRTKRQFILTEEANSYRVDIVFDSLNNSPTPFQGSQRFSVKTFNQSVISVSKPASALPSERWYLRVSPGDIKYSERRYWVPEYYNQLYNPLFPYRAVKEKRGLLVEPNLIYADLYPIANLRIGGFYVDIIIKDASGAVVRALTNNPDADTYVTKNGFVTDIFYEKDIIESVSSNSGFIKLREKINPRHQVFLNYRYEEKFLTYDGLSVNPSINPEILGKRVLIYCKPNQTERAIHHLVVQNNGLIERSSESPRFETVNGKASFGDQVSLIDSSLSLDEDYYTGYELEILSGDNSGRRVKISGYDKENQKIFFEDALPYSIVPNVVYRINKKLSSYTTTEAILGKTYSYIGWEEQSTNNAEQKLADVFVIQTVAIDDIKSFDARVVGGGIREERVREALALQDEVRWYWDIGNFDGDPYPGMGAILVELPRYILKELGGPFTREQVQQVVEKHMGDGSYPLIKYYDNSTEITDIETGNGFVEINWRVIQANGYNIYVGNSPDNLSLVKEEPGTRSSTRIEGLENNKEYFIQVEPIVGGVKRLRSRALSFIPFDYTELDPPIKYEKGLYSGGTYE